MKRVESYDCEEIVFWVIPKRMYYEFPYQLVNFRIKYTGESNNLLGWHRLLNRPHFQLECKMDAHWWIQQVTTRVGAVTSWIHQPASPKQVLGFTCVCMRCCEWTWQCDLPWKQNRCYTGAGHTISYFHRRATCDNVCFTPGKQWK